MNSHTWGNIEQDSVHYARGSLCRVSLESISFNGLRTQLKDIVGRVDTSTIRIRIMITRQCLNLSTPNHQNLDLGQDVS
jgi:hypothetical protein